jgi:adenine-specific DNA-methyltransferase
VKIVLVIKYLGSKRTLMPLLGALVESSGASTTLDLFTGTTRVAKAMKLAGKQVTALDSATYSKVFADTWIALDASTVNQSELTDAISHLASLPGECGYFTQSFCLEARYFQPFNGERVDAMREAIARDYAGTWLEQPLIAALLLATDRVDSTTGVQMAYLKKWSWRSGKPLELKDPGLIDGPGAAYLGDALELTAALPAVDLAYLDPPYNQHRYFGNYHVWESLVRWDKPATYGVANKREDVRGDENRSAFNSRRTMPQAIQKVLTDVNAETIVLSYNNESWLSREELIEMCSNRGHVEILDFEFKRYIGSQIGIYNRTGALVGQPGVRRNFEHLLLAGPKKILKRMIAETEHIEVKVAGEA